MGRIDGWVAPRRAPAEIGCVCKANLSNDRCAETRSRTSYRPWGLSLAACLAPPKPSELLGRRAQTPNHNCPAKLSEIGKKDVARFAGLLGSKSPRVSWRLGPVAGPRLLYRWERISDVLADFMTNFTLAKRLSVWTAEGRRLRQWAE